MDAAQINTLEQAIQNPGDFALPSKERASDALKAAEELFTKSRMRSAKGGGVLHTKGFDTEQIWQQIQLNNAPTLKRLSRSLGKLLEHADSMVLVKQQPARQAQTVIGKKTHPGTASHGPGTSAARSRSVEGPKAGKRSVKFARNFPLSRTDEGEGEDLDALGELDGDLDAIRDMEMAAEDSALARGGAGGRDEDDESDDSADVSDRDLNKLLDDGGAEGTDVHGFIGGEGDSGSDSEGWDEHPLSDDSDRDARAKRAQYADFFDALPQDGVDGLGDVPPVELPYDDEMIMGAQGDPIDTDSEGESGLGEEEGDEDGAEAEAESGDRTKLDVTEEEEDDEEENEEEDEEEEEDDTPPVLESAFEKKQRQLQERVYKMEQQRLKQSRAVAEPDTGNPDEPKTFREDWALAGEVGRGDRPVNSLLDHPVEYDNAQKLPAVITESHTAAVEEMIKARIKSGVFDDVVRRDGPRENRSIGDEEQLKGKPGDITDSMPEKGKRVGLGEQYADEYQRQQGLMPEAGDPEAEVLRAECTALFAQLSNRLDALTNLHFVPRRPAPTLSVVSNVPALTAEEATPGAVSTQARQAPREVYDAKGAARVARLREKEDRRRAEEGSASEDGGPAAGRAASRDVAAELGSALEPGASETTRKERRAAHHALKRRWKKNNAQEEEALLQKQALAHPSAGAGAGPKSGLKRRKPRDGAQRKRTAAQGGAGADAAAAAGPKSSRDFFQKLESVVRADATGAGAKRQKKKHAAASDGHSSSQYKM